VPASLRAPFLQPRKQFERAFQIPATSPFGRAAGEAR
jgi:hypothetical protein